MKKQAFLEFICEVLLYSPSGKRDYRDRRNVTKTDGNDALRYLDIRSPDYKANADFLVKQCKQLRVRSQDANKPIIYDIAKLGLPATRQEFEWKSKEKRTVTVAQYYKEHYNLDLKYPSLPVLETRNKAYLPMELVDVEPARVKKITDEQRALLCRYSSMKPQEYGRSINNIRKNPQQQCFEDDPFVRAWNLNVDVKMITVPARVLPMPEIVYTNQYQVKENSVRDLGTWELPKTIQFHQPTAIPSPWAMINVSNLDEPACVNYFNQLQIVAGLRGINFPEPNSYREFNPYGDTPDLIINGIVEMIRNNNKYRFLLVILPPKTTDLSKRAYRNVKKLCELADDVGVVTQVIQHTNAVIGTKKDRNAWDVAK